MATHEKEPDSRREEAPDAAYGGFEKRLSYDSFVKKIEQKKRKKSPVDSEPSAKKPPRRRKWLVALVSLLAIAAAVALAVGLWLLLR